MNRTALEQVLAAERLEGWDPSDEQIAELEAVLVGTLSRREYFEQELARAVGLSSPIPPRIRWRRSAPYVYRGTSVLENNFDVRDPAALQSLEFAATALRLGEAHLGSDLVPHTRDTAELLLLHQHVFQDLYQWPATSERSTSGKVRRRLRRSRRFGTICPRWKRSSPPSIG